MAFICGRSKPVFRPLALLLPLVALLGLSGCSAVNLENINFSKIFAKKQSPTVNKTAEQLMDMGMANLKKQNFSEAAEDFKKLKEKYPYSKYATLAGLKLGDAYFGDQKYAQAAMSYKEFARLHPSNENAPYVLYQAGMSHFLQFSATDRDPAETATSIKVFNTLIDNYPGTEYATKAAKQLVECKKRITCHLFGVARQYYVMEQYAAAKVRLVTMKTQYPKETAELGYQPRVEEMLAKCDREVAKGPPKPDIWTRIGL